MALLEDLGCEKGLAGLKEEISEEKALRSKNHRKELGCQTDHSQGLGQKDRALSEFGGAECIWT